MTLENALEQFLKQVQIDSIVNPQKLECKIVNDYSSWKLICSNGETLMEELDHILINTLQLIGWVSATRKEDEYVVTLCAYNTACTHDPEVPNLFPNEIVAA
jgi:hypothetical protein